VRASHQGAQASQQFFGVKGLGEVVVGPGVDASDLFMPAVSCGQDQNRRCLAVTAPALQDGQAVQHGEPQIQHDRVIRLCRAEVQGFLSVGRFVNGIADLIERRLEL
jgi:hypothetical protein